MNFEIGDIILYDSGTKVGNIITKITNYPFSHVALAVSHDEVIEANAFIKSRRVKFKDTKYNKVVILRFKKGLTSKQKEILIKESVDLLGKGYDYYGIFLLMIKYVCGFDMKYIHNDITRLWCTEMIDFVYEKIHLDLVPTAHNNFVSVEDIAESKELIEVGTMYAPVETIFDNNKPFTR